MVMGPRQHIGGAILVLSLCALTGCGGGSGYTAANLAGPPSGVTQSPAPPPAASPQPNVSAPAFNGAYPTSGSFTVSHALFSSAPGGAPVLGHDGTVVFTTNGATTSVQLVIPSLNINSNLIPDYAAGLAQQQRDPIDWGIDPAGGLVALSYLVLGEWQTGGSGQTKMLQLQFGMDTPASAMPANGKATFTGGAQGFFGAGYYPTAQGNASLTVDFTSGAITGAFTQMQVYCGCGTGGGSTPWNDVSVSASIAGGTNRFAGTTAVMSAPGTPLSLSSSAMGRIDGGFFGPTAQSIGGVWTLSDGANSVIGTVFANH